MQISKALGATRIVTIGKPGVKLERTKSLGATDTIALAARLEETDLSLAADVDVVLDYLWGDVAEASLKGILKSRQNLNQRLRWIEIGAMAGDESPISAALLRQANIAILGCGPGSWNFGELNAQMPAMLSAIVQAGMTTEFEVKRLSDVETWWSEPSGSRIVVTP